MNKKDLATTMAEKSGLFIQTRVYPDIDTDFTRNNVENDIYR